MSRLQAWRARTAAIRAAAKGEAAPIRAAPVAKPSAAAALASSPVPAVPKASASSAPTLRQPRLSEEERKRITVEVLAAVAADAKAQRQAEIAASWERAHAAANGRPMSSHKPAPVKAENHGWAAIHQQIRAERAATRKGIPA